MTHEYMSNISKSIEIKAPVDTVFTYFARPEHVSDQMSDKGVGMTVIPMDIKEGMGVGTTFRIIGNFGKYFALSTFEPSGPNGISFYTHGYAVKRKLIGYKCIYNLRIF